ncbi:hypothetical protein DFJ63DRAFT_319903 [Scheffersomyces coipomensis]|uniref:uncharacterized protein n=1 Tax=Scheffersomyces coipomensis TaxID=1788519 RepID=UPI00315D9375
MKNVQLYVDNAERYEELIRTASLEDNENQLDDELKFTLLKSLLDGGLRPQTSESAPTPPVTSESVTPAPSTSEFSERSTVIVPKEIDTTDKVVISTKKIGNNSRVISLMLTNNTTHIINGGDLKFEFYDSIRNEVVIVKNANSVKPGQTRFYNLGGINKIFDKLSGMNMKITTSNGILEGVYNEFDDSILSFVSVDDSMEVDPKETLLTLTNEDEINVTLIPKSSSLAQIIIHNRSEKTVDCSDLKLEIVNCFGKSVVGVMIRKSHGILPGKIGKFNIGLINAHMKFPFKLIMRNDYNIGHCELSLKNLSGNFNFDPQPVDNQVEQPDLINLEQTPEFDGEDAVMEEDDHSSGTESIIDEKEEIEVVTEETKERETPESEESLLESGSIHSIIVPSLPKESVPLVDSEYLDAKDTVTESKAEEAETPAEEPQHEDDYDIISDGDHEFDSDFEILSPVTSNQ